MKKQKYVLIGTVQIIFAATFFSFLLFFNSKLKAQNNLPIQKEALEIRPLASLFNTKKKFIDYTTEDTLFIKKRFWRASGELMLVQLIPWAYNYYVREAEFAKVTWESVWYNIHFKNSEWDDNNFKTNQYAHPLQGSLYFSSFRSNGYNFWESAPAAFAGSYLWEIAAETHLPAPNDLINTTLGGISLGEMTYRFSNLIVNNRQAGFKRQINEVLALIINPMNGFNRIMDGRWGKVMANSPERVPDYLSGNLDLGYRRINNDIDNVFSKGKLEFFVRANIQYGNPLQDFEKPFSNFSMVGELAAADSAKLNIQVNGFLMGNEIRSNESVNHVIALTMNYDYLNNNPIQYGAQSFNLKLLSNYSFKNNSNINTEVGIIGVAIAAVPDDYLYYGEGRNYDYGPGGGFLLNTKLDLKNKLWLIMNYKGIWFKTVNGNESHFFLNSITADLRYYFTPQFSLAIQRGFYVQNSFYADYDETVKKYPYGRITIGWEIGSK